MRKGLTAVLILLAAFSIMPAASASYKSDELAGCIQEVYMGLQDEIAACTDTYRWAKIYCQDDYLYCMEDYWGYLESLQEAPPVFTIGGEPIKVACRQYFRLCLMEAKADNYLCTMDAVLNWKMARHSCKFN